MFLQRRRWGIKSLADNEGLRERDLAPGQLQRGFRQLLTPDEGLRRTEGTGAVQGTPDRIRTGHHYLQPDKVRQQKGTFGSFQIR